jgi:ABC-2 type transport system permease protein
MRVRGPRAFLLRLHAMVVKEFLQLLRDRVTLALIVMIPLMELVLFGYAINMNPRHLPLAVLSADNSPAARAFVQALANTRYFDIRRRVRSEAEAEALIRSGKVQFVLRIPPGFARDVYRGLRPELLLLADATDPVATGSAVSAVSRLATRTLRHELSGPGGHLLAGEPPFRVIVHQRYNPAQETAINVVPGIVGIILTMTLLIFTAMAVTREVERGTMESLLATPLTPVEIMLGKIAPYIIVGFVQMVIVLAAGHVLFGVPVVGSLLLLVALTLLFIATNLALGYTVSTMARTQLQAMQMAFFIMLPSILMSGFVFPFAGMPGWARFIGEMLPLTHYLRIIRGILLKGAGWADVRAEALALAVIMLTVMIVAVHRFRRTLD